MTALFWIVVIFGVCTLVAGVDEAIDRWGTRRSIRRREERLRLRREARAEYDYANQTLHVGRRVW